MQKAQERYRYVHPQWSLLTVILTVAHRRIFGTSEGPFWGISAPQEYAE